MVLVGLQLFEQCPINVVAHHLVTCLDGGAKNRLLFEQIVPHAQPL